MARTSGEIKNINDVVATIAKKKTQKENYSKEEELLNKLQGTLRILDDTVITELFEYIRSSPGKAIYDEGFENKEDNYYKLYFNYIGYTGIVEQGYIPSITLYSDKRLHIPLKSQEYSSSSDRTLVELVLEDELYDKLIKHISSIQPK